MIIIRTKNLSGFFAQRAAQLESQSKPLPIGR